MAVVIAGGWGSKLTDVDSVTSAVVVVVVVVDVKEEGSWSSSYGPNYQKLSKISQAPIKKYFQMKPKPVVNSVKSGDCKIVGVVESGSTIESVSLLGTPKV